MSLAWTVVDWAAVVLATAVAGGGDGGQDVGGVGEGGGCEKGAGGEGGRWTLGPLALYFRVDASEKTHETDKREKTIHKKIIMKKM